MLRLAPSVISLKLVAVRVQLDSEILEVACCQCAKGQSASAPLPRLPPRSVTVPFL